MKFSSVLLLSVSLLSFQAHAMDTPDKERSDEHFCPTTRHSMPQVILGMDDLSNPGTQKPPSGMQLAKGADDTLEAPLGTGANVMLKISMDLKDFRRCTESKPMDVPVRLFLTDFTSSPINHPAVNFQVMVDYELRPLKYVLPDKPASFDSYAQFTSWLEQGYFTNQVGITYDFQVDVQKSAPSLAQQLFCLPPDGYHFIGMHVIDNPKIIPDSCEPKVSYVSQRGDTNATTVTLGGILHLNKKPYSIEEHHQIFPHRKVAKKICKTENTKNFYHYQWIALSEVTSINTFGEFPNNLENWPNAPSGNYSLPKQKPMNKHQIEHLSCVSGTGEEIDIKTSNAVFKIISGEINGKGEEINEAIVKDDRKILYYMKYRNLTIEEVNKNLSIERVIEDYRLAKDTLNQKNRVFEETKKYARSQLSSHYCKYKNDHTEVRASYSSGYFDACCCSPKLYEASSVFQEQREAENNERAQAKKLLDCMRVFSGRIGCPHPRWGQFKELELRNL